MSKDATDWHAGLTDREIALVLAGRRAALATAAEIAGEVTAASRGWLRPQMVGPEIERAIRELADLSPG